MYVRQYGVRRKRLTVLPDHRSLRRKAKVTCMVALLAVLLCILSVLRTIFTIHITARVYRVQMATVKDEWSARLMYDRDARATWAHLLLSFIPLSLPR